MKTAIDFLRQQPEYTNKPVTDSSSIFYHVAPMTFARLMDLYAELKVKEALSQQPPVAVAWPSENEYKDLERFCAVGFHETQAVRAFYKRLKPLVTAIDLEDFLKWMSKHNCWYNSNTELWQYFIINDSEDELPEFYNTTNLIEKYNEDKQNKNE